MSSGKTVQTGRRVAMPDPSAALYSAAFYTFVALTIATVTVAARLPVYADEVVWKFLQDRYFHDGARTVSAFPGCGVTDFAIPRLLVPFRLFDTAIYQDISGPGMVRAIGVGLSLVWGGLTWGLLRRSGGGGLSGRRNVSTTMRRPVFRIRLGLRASGLAD